jgi:hypothetical protein
MSSHADTIRALRSFLDEWGQIPDDDPSDDELEAWGAALDALLAKNARLTAELELSRNLFEALLNMYDELYAQTEQLRTEVGK